MSASPPHPVPLPQGERGRTAPSFLPLSPRGGRVRGRSSARVRGYLWQALALLLVLAFLAFIARNAAINMARLGINTGFGFLTRPAGFAIAQHFVAYDEASSYFAAF